MSPCKRIFEVPCEDETHCIGLDNDGCLYLLDHDIEEEETLYLMGEYPSNCYRVLMSLESNPDRTLMLAASNGWDDMVELCFLLGADPREKNDWSLRLASSNGHPFLAGKILKVINELKNLDWYAKWLGRGTVLEGDREGLKRRMPELLYQDGGW